MICMLQFLGLALVMIADHVRAYQVSLDAWHDEYQARKLSEVGR